MIVCRGVLLAAFVLFEFFVSIFEDVFGSSVKDLGAEEVEYYLRTSPTDFCTDL